MVLVPRARWQVDAASAVFAVVACLGLGASGQPDWYWSAAMAATLVVRRTLPWVFAVAVMGISCAHLLIDDRLLFPGDLLLLVAVYTLASHASARTRHGGLVTGGVYVGVLLLQIVIDDGMQDFPRSFSPAALVIAGMIAAWAVGLLERHRRDALTEAERGRVLAERDAEARTRVAAYEERERMSNDIHDVLAHTLTGIIVQAESGRAVSAEDEPRELFTRISETGRAALREVRGLLAADENPDTQPSPGIEDVDDLLEGFEHAGLDVQRADRGVRADLMPGMALAIYRVIQESLTNALRHGSGQTASLTLDWEPEALTVTVVNAVEHDVDLSAATNRRGLSGIRRRSALYEGRAEIRADDEFAVVTVWPLASPTLREAS
ncbi:sensor histidine kinase [Microbacterium lacticum]